MFQLFLLILPFDYSILDKENTDWGQKNWKWNEMRKEKLPIYASRLSDRKQRVKKIISFFPVNFTIFIAIKNCKITHSFF